MDGELCLWKCMLLTCRVMKLKPDSNVSLEEAVPPNMSLATCFRELSSGEKSVANAWRISKRGRISMCHDKSSKRCHNIRHCIQNPMSTLNMALPSMNLTVAHVWTHFAARSSSRWHGSVLVLNCGPPQQSPHHIKSLSELVVAHIS